MITFVKLVCPSCGANLEVDSKLSQCFCQYCGTKILLHNENEHTININQTSRFVDEAELAKQENERKKIEFEQKKYEDKKAEKDEPGWPGTVGGLLGFGSLMSGTFGLICMTNNNFLSFIVGTMCLLSIIAMWCGFYVMLGRTAIKPKIGLIILIASGILCLLFSHFAFQFLPKS